VDAQSQRGTGDCRDPGGCQRLLLSGYGVIWVITWRQPLCELPWHQRASMAANFYDSDPTAVGLPYVRPAAGVRL
jgi:hypothetical protein